MKPYKAIQAGLTVSVLSLLFSAILMAAPVSITMWHPFPDRDEFGAWQTLVDQFNAENPDIQVTLEGKSGYTSNTDGLIVPIASGVGPDIVFFSYHATPLLAANQVFLDLRPLMERDGFLNDFNSDFLPGTMGALTWQGGIYGVAADASVMVPMYLPELLESSGVAAPAPNWTWDDMIDLVRNVRRMGANGEWDVFPGMDDHPIHTYLPFVLQAGARFFDKDIRHSMVDSNEMREALEFLARIFDEGYLAWNPERRELFLSGKAAILFGSDASIGNLFLERQPGLRVAHPPRHPDRQPSTAMVFHTLSIVRSGDREKEEASWKLLRFLSSTESQVHVATISGKMPPRISALRDSSFQDARREVPALMDVLEVLPMGTTEGWVGLPDAGPYISTVISGGLGKARPGPGRASVEEIIQDMHVKTQNLIDEFWANAK